MTPSEYAEAFSGFNPRPEDVNRHRMLGGREPQPRQAGSVMVDQRTADDLTTSLRDLAAAVSEPGIGRTERLARMELLTGSVEHLRASLQWLDPYLHGGSRLRDEATVHSNRPGDRSAAAARIEAARQHARAWADLGPLVGYGGVHPAGTGISSPGGLLALATPAGDLAPAHLSRIPVADELPTAVLDPNVESEALAYQHFVINDVAADWHVSALAVNLSRQVLDFTARGQDEIDHLISVAVDRRLEGAILSDLATGAPTAATLAAGETAAATAWPSGGETLVIHSPADKPAIRQAYASTPEAWLPTLVGSSAVTPGTAYVAIADALIVEVSTPTVLSVDEPALLGRGIAYMRHGRALSRAAGAIQSIAL